MPVTCFSVVAQCHLPEHLATHGQTWAEKFTNGAEETLEGKIQKDYSNSVALSLEHIFSLQTIMQEHEDLLLEENW